MLASQWGRGNKALDRLGAFLPDGRTSTSSRRCGWHSPSSPSRVRRAPVSGPALRPGGTKPPHRGRGSRPLPVGLFAAPAVMEFLRLGPTLLEVGGMSGGSSWVSCVGTIPWRTPPGLDRPSSIAALRGGRCVSVPVASRFRCRLAGPHPCKEPPTNAREAVRLDRGGVLHAKAERTPF